MSWRRDRLTNQEELAAQMIETLDWWGRAHAVLLGAKPSALPEQVQIHRPGTETKPKAAGLSEVAAFFAATGPRALRKLN